jgi:hypothetical protein
MHTSNLELAGTALLNVRNKPVITVTLLPEFLFLDHRLQICLAGHPMISNH